MQNDSTELIIRDLDSQLSNYRQSYQGLTWREKVLLLVQVLATLKGLGKDTNPEVSKVDARERIRLYFIHHVSTVIAANELEVVSGISEYRRRTSE